MPAIKSDGTAWQDREEYNRAAGIVPEPSIDRPMWRVAESYQERLTDLIEEANEVKRQLAQCIEQMTITDFVLYRKVTGE